MEIEMKYVPLVAQISALTMAAISKRPDAMGYAAIFAVLCVVAVVFKNVFGSDRQYEIPS